MKKIFSTIISLILCLSVFASPVNLEKAIKVAKNFYQQLSPERGFAESDFSLVYTAKSKEIGIQNGTNSEIATFYIFNINENQGFVLISADDATYPILGYSMVGEYDESNAPPAFRKLLEKYKLEISDIIINNYEPNDNIVQEWMVLESGGRLSEGKESMAVNPLIQTKWSQSPYVNAMCPYDANAGSYNDYHCVTGCPATAMAQIMKYWNYPTMGVGFHSYNHNDYGTLSANFASTTYNWSSMPNTVSSANSAVATIMYHCGVAVEMGYGPTVSGSYVIISGSPTPEQCSEYAFKTYFGYNSTTIQGLKRSSYSDTNWKNILKAELNAGRPIQYAGFGQGGHTFVCDGYDSSDYFHMNWGWGGSCDGYFSLNALNPGTGGTGSGAGTYNEGQQALIGIQPASGGSTSTGVIDLNSSISISPNPIDFAQSFSVNADVTNSGTGNFSGDYCAALFTASGDFIDYVQTLSAGSNPLLPGYHYTGGLTFSSSGILAVPGSYKIGIFYKNSDENWELAGNASYTNPISVTINSPTNYIQLYSDLNVTPNTFVHGQSASVNFNILNNNSSTYFGSYCANLYDLEGNFVQTIGTINETNGLPSGYVYSSPFLTVNTTSISAEPGSYILAILEKENGSSNWYLVGGEDYTNPVNINVVEPSMSADIYETNNIESTAYNLSLNFSGGTANKQTNGSNFHIGSDLDYYKLVLPTGYNYSISARLHDSYNSDNGQTYTGDAMFSYKKNSTWSDNFDDIMPTNISVSNGGTILFNVAPYFVGGTGTYLLDMSITRTTELNSNSLNEQSISVYPNPATKDFYIIFSDLNLKINSIKMFDCSGREVSEFDLPEYLDPKIYCSIGDIKDGLYFIQITTEKGIVSKPIVIKSF
ncbi:MAG TPA: C10 family peptidase [Bacteroidales bacterium]|nr:C10 family peptidase [Bacteroidales bacterium]